MPLRELVNGDRAGEAGEMRFVLMLEKYKAQTAGGLAQTPQTHTLRSWFVEAKVLLESICGKINE